MANRNAVKEMLGIICVALLFPRSEKAPTPTGNTGYIIDTADAIQYERPNAIKVGPVTPAADTGLLSYLFSFLATVISLLGDEVLGIIASFLWSKALPLLMTILKRCIIFVCIGILRVLGAPARATDVNAVNTPPPTNTIDESSRPSPPQPATTPADDEDEWFDAETSQSPPEDRPENAPAPPTDSQALTDLRAESAAKDAQIAALSRDAENKSDTIALRDRQKNSLMATLRKTLDPKNLYSPNTDVVTLASDIARDVKRVSRKIDRKKIELAKARSRQENGKLSENAREIDRLSTENTRLNGRIVGLEEGQQSSVLEVERIEQVAREKEKTLRERTLAAESASSRQAIEQRTYETLSDQFQTVAAELRRVRRERQEAIDAQAALTTELQAERTRVQEPQPAADSEAELRQPSESLMTTETSDLQTANERIATLEQEALTKTEEVSSAETRVEDADKKAQDAETRAEGAEVKAQDAEKKAQDAEKKAKDAGKKAEVAETKARTAEERVAEHAKTSQELQQKLERAEKTIKDSDANPKVVEPSRNQDLLTQVDNLKAELSAAQQKETDAFNTGYRNAVDDCNVQGQKLIADAVRQESLEAQQRLATALAQREQAVKTSVDAHWQNRETIAQAQFQGAVATEVFRRANQVQTQLIEATQRAITAENATADAETKRGDEWERANREEQRAKAAETELQKHKAGVAQNAQPNAAEWEALENDRKRAMAINDEVLHRHYDYSAKVVLEQLLKANAKIDTVKALLKHPFRQPSQIQLLMVLLDAEVNETNISKLGDVAINRQVILKQSKAVNARLAVLKTMINASEEPSKQRLFDEILKPRGDEDATWCDDDPAPESSSDEDEDVKISTQRKRDIRVPKLRQVRPEPPAPVQATPSPSDPNVHRELKRKGSPEDAEADASLKKRNDRDEDMRPVAGPSSGFAQQGVLSPDAAADPMETKRESQDEMPLSRRIAETSAPQQQSEDQIDISTQPPRMPPSLSPYFNYPNPATSSETSSHNEHAPHNKLFKIPGPKPNARLTASERQQRLRYRQFPESEAVPEQGRDTSPSAGSPTTFSFSVSKSEASAFINPIPPLEPGHKPIFKGLSLLGAATADKKWMPDKNAALPGLPPPEDEVLEFESSTAAEDRDATRELDDTYLAHVASDDDEDDEAEWEDALYPPETDDNIIINLHGPSSTETGNDRRSNRHQSLSWLDDEVAPVPALDMTESNYEEQDAEAAAAAASQGTPQAQPKTASQPQNSSKEELEDNFTIELE